MKNYSSNRAQKGKTAYRTPSRLKISPQTDKAVKETQYFRSCYATRQEINRSVYAPPRKKAAKK
ncbi:MAG: hypothetical protein WC430_03640 [Patescibacteria group bacterium]